MKLIPISDAMIDELQADAQAIQHAAQQADFYQRAGIALQDQLSQRIQSVFGLDSQAPFSIDLETKVLRVEEPPK